MISLVALNIARRLVAGVFQQQKRNIFWQRVSGWWTSPQNPPCFIISTFYICSTKFAKTIFFLSLRQYYTSFAIGKDRRKKDRLAYFKIVCDCMNINLQLSVSRAQKYIVCHNHIVLSFVLSSLTNANTVLLCSTLYFALWNRSMGDFCSYTRKRFSGKPIFWLRN